MKNKKWYETDSNPFEDIKYLEEKYKELCGTIGKFPIHKNSLKYLTEDKNGKK